jgi:hypothetical protein
VTTTARSSKATAIFFVFISLIVSIVGIIFKVEVGAEHRVRNIGIEDRILVEEYITQILADTLIDFDYSYFLWIGVLAKDGTTAGTLLGAGSCSKEKCQSANGKKNFFHFMVCNITLNQNAKIALFFHLEKKKLQHAAN